MEKYKQVNVAEATKLAAAMIKTFGVRLADINKEIKKLQVNDKQKLHH